MAFQPNDFRPGHRFGAPDLDMTPDGRFRRPATLPLGTRIGLAAVLVAALAGAIAMKGQPASARVIVPHAARATLCLALRALLAADAKENTWRDGCCMIGSMRSGWMQT